MIAAGRRPSQTADAVWRRTRSSPTSPLAQPGDPTNQGREGLRPGPGVGFAGREPERPRFDGAILQDASAKGVLGGGPTQVEGNASLRIQFENMPKGTRTSAEFGGLFKEVQLNRGRSVTM